MVERARAWGVMVAAVALLCACERGELKAEPHTQTAPSAATRWISPVPAGHGGWLEAPARVVAAPDGIAQISAPLSARVVHVRVAAGQTVAAGGALVDVVMPELLKAAGMLRAAELRLESWNKRREIIAPLVEKQLAQRAELNDIDANIASVRGDMESARAVLRAAGESDKRVTSLLDGSGVISLRAPFAGVVVAVTARVGEVREPAAGPLVEMVNEHDDAQVEARFMTSPPKDATFVWTDGSTTLPLVLVRLSPRADERDGSRVGWLRSADARAGLVAGTLGRVRIVAGDDWMAVPARALQQRAGVTTVEQMTSNGSRRTPVHVVQQSGTEAIITGLPREAKIAAEIADDATPP